MALIKGNATQVSIPLSVTVTRDGAEQVIEFTALYKLRTRAEQLEQAQHLDSEEYDGIERPMMRIARAKDALRESVVGWTGLHGSDGEEVGFSAETLDEMLADDDYYDALIEGMRESMAPGARRKN